MPRLHSPSLFISLAELYPSFRPIHTPLYWHCSLPLLSFSLLFFFRRMLSSSLQYRSSFIVRSLTSLFTRHWPWSHLFLIAPFHYVFKPDESSLERRPRAFDPKLLLQSYLRTILASPDSRKIFYFLLLNLAFMLVQMLWTNSLGLISDAIHMAFDWMAIAMGLLASVLGGE